MPVKLPSIETSDRALPKPSGGVASYRGATGAETAPGEAGMAAGESLRQVGQAGMGAADQIYQAIKIEQEKADTTRVEDAWNKYKNAALDITMGEKGVLNTRGAEAVNGDLVKVTPQRLGEARKRILDELGNDEQKARFEQRAAATDLQVKHQVLGHLETEGKAYAKTTMDGSVAAAVAQISAMPTSPDVFLQAKDTLLAQADQYLKLNGITDKAAKEGYRAKIIDDLWKSRIDSLLYSQPMLADALLRANEKEITNPELKLTLQARTREASTGVSAGIEAQRVIDEVREKMAPAQVGTVETGGGMPYAGAQPRSIRNNNPGNIEKRPVKWQGEVEGQDPRFATFATYEDGLRAMQQNLLTYQEKHGLTTVEGIINRWAPAGENGDKATRNYIRVVSDALGVKPGDKIDLKDPLTLQAMTSAMAQVEAGGSASAPAAGGLRKVGNAEPTAQNTSGMPNTRDVAAQLPIMMLRVEKTADKLYGSDPGNPDRAAFVKRMTAEVHSRVAADVQQLNAIQRQAQGAMIDAVTGTGGGQAGGMMPTGGTGRAGTPGTAITSFSQIQSNPELYKQWQLLDPQAKLGIERLMEHNLRASDQGDTVLYRDMFNRIHLPQGHPNKVDFYQQVVDPRVADRLSMQQIQQLRLEIDRNETPGGRSLNQLRKGADTQVGAWFKTNIMFTAQPERALAATMRWNEDVGRKIDEYAGTPGGADKVRAMFQLDTKESVVSPAYLQTYVDSTPAQGLAAGAAAARDKEPKPVMQPPTIDSREKLDAWFKTLPEDQTTFVGVDGKARFIPGRKPVEKDAGTALSTMDGTGKLISVPSPEELQRKRSRFAPEKK